MKYQNKNNQIFIKLKSKLSRYYDELRLIPMSKEYYFDYVTELISRCSCENEEEVFNLIKDQTIELILNSDNCFEFINGYINDNFSINSDILDFFNKLNNLLLKCKKLIDLDFYIELLNKNKLLYFITELYFKKREEQIIGSNLWDLLDCDVLVYCLQAYLIINNIELKEEIIDFDYEFDYDYKTDSLTQYLNEIKQYKVLDAHEERKIIIATQCGNIEARDLFIKCNLRLVASIVLKNYNNKGISILDLIQEGNIGMMRALDKFNVNAGYKFSTYAYPWIKQYIERYIERNGRNIRISSNFILKINKYKTVYSELEIKLGRKPTRKEISVFAGLSESDIELIEKNLSDVLSLDAKCDNNEDFKISDSIVDPSPLFEEEYIEQEQIKILMDSFSKAKLSDREVEILKCRNGFYGNIMSYEKIGKKYNISKERVRKIEIATVKKIKEYLEKTGVLSEKINVDNINSKLIYDYFKDYSREQINYAIKFLNEGYKKLIYLHLGKNLNKLYASRLNSEQIKMFDDYVLIRIFNILLMIFGDRNSDYKKELNKKTFDIMLCLLEMYPFTIIKENISLDVLITGLLKLGYVNGDTYSDEVIAKFFNTSVENITKYFRDFLRLTKSDPYINSIVKEKEFYLKLANLTYMAKINKKIK